MKSSLALTNINIKFKIKVMKMKMELLNFVNLYETIRHNY